MPATPLDHPALVLPGPDTAVLEAALMYARADLAPLPLYGIRGDGACGCGKHDCPPRNAGKHPTGNGWQTRASCDPDVVRDRFQHHRGNVGIYLALGGYVLVDADGELGLETARTWDLPLTLTARSGSGSGAHYIYRLGPGHDASLITDRKVAPGLDVKVRGQFVASPSVHHSGGRYEWVTPIAPTVMPDWLFDRLRKQPASASRLVVAAPSGDSLEKRARAYLAKIGPAISGSRGHDQCFAAARALAGWAAKGLSDAAAFSLLVEYNATCQPPWSQAELEHKWHDAKAAHTVPALEDRPRVPHLRAVGPNDPGPPPPPGGSPPSGKPDWRQELLWAETRSGNGKLVSHVDNVIRILQLHPEWKGKIGFDEFRARIVVANDAPWDSYQRPQRYLSAWTDNDTTRLQSWMRRQFHGYQFDPKVNDCERAVGVVARTHDFNPVRDYLDSVAWDGVPRLARWTSTYLGTEDSEYHRLVGAWWLISACARIYDPGCKVDTVPILEGPQGIRKSSCLRVLAGADWYNDTPIDLGSKDAYTAIQGCWFVELAELESLMRAEPSRSKAFFSSSKDRFRRAYARHESEELRQCIFVGTVNLGEYLSDPTGARRFWPIRCTRIDLEALARDRDQLWAEAVHEYQEGRLWYPTGESENELLAPQQETRTKGDAWEKLLGSYLRKTASQQVTADELLEGALRLEPKDWTPAAQTRVGILMLSRFRWSKRRPTINGERVWVYERPLLEVGQ